MELERSALIEHIAQLAGKLIVAVNYIKYDYDTEEDVFEFQIENGLSVTVREPLVCGEVKEQPTAKNVIPFEVPVKKRSTAVR